MMYMNSRSRVRKSREEEKYFWIHEIGPSTVKLHTTDGGMSSKINPFTEFQEIALSQHNEYRKIHRNTPQLKLNWALCLEAQRDADYFVDSVCQLRQGEFSINYPCRPSKSEDVGQNIFTKNCVIMEDGLSTICCAFDGDVVTGAVDKWYEEKSSYNYKTGASDDNQRRTINHFAQVCYYEGAASWNMKFLKRLKTLKMTKNDRFETQKCHF